MGKINNGTLLGAATVAACAAGMTVMLLQKKNEKEQRLQEQCKTELKLRGDKFEGLYGATERLLQKEHAGQEAEELCFRWESRLENDERTAGLRKAWRQFDAYDAKRRMEKWYGLLMAAGVKKGEEKEVSVDRAALRKYDLPDEAGNCIGKMMHVEVPCWMLGEKVLEKGTLS